MYKFNLNFIITSAIIFIALTACTTSDVALFTESAILNTLDSHTEIKNTETKNRKSLNRRDAVHAVTGSLLVVSAEKYKQYQERAKLKFPETENVDTTSYKPVTSQTLSSEDGPAINQDFITINKISYSTSESIE